MEGREEAYLEIASSPQKRELSMSAATPQLLKTSSPQNYCYVQMLMIFIFSEG